MTSDRPEPAHTVRTHARTLVPKLVHVAEVAKTLAARGSAIWVEAVRDGLTRRGLYLYERGNQSIGDALGRAGFGLTGESRTFLRFEAPDAPKPPGWRRVSYIEHPAGLTPYVRSRRCYTWPPGGIDRAYLEARFRVPSNWDWSKYDL